MFIDIWEYLERGTGSIYDHISLPTCVEFSAMLLDRKDQHNKNGNPTKSNLLI